MRKRGNPNWGRPLHVPAIVTEFEMQVRRLGIDKSEFISSRELLHWCQRNRNRVYVPEWLLEAWGMQVDVIFGWAA